MENLKKYRITITRRKGIKETIDYIHARNSTDAIITAMEVHNLGRVNVEEMMV